MVMMTIMIMVRNCQRCRRMYHNKKLPFQKDVPLAKTASTDSGETSARTALPEGPDAVWQMFKERKRVLDSGCSQYLQQRGEIKRWFTGLYLSISQNVFYCPIEKTGSTEWRLLFKNASNHGVTVETIGSTPFPFIPLETIQPYRHSPIRFLFVREPYHRLVSAYVDMFLSPNVDFWSSFGRYIVNKFRANASRLSRKCGHDVTFAEFIAYVIDAEKTGVRTNGHFSPQVHHCHVCEFPYTHLGHLETLPEDREFLLNAMDFPVDYVKDYPIENLQRQVQWYLGEKERYRACVTVGEALRRLWQKLKIRGYLHKDIRYPLTTQQSEYISVRAFVSIGSKAIELSKKVSADLKGNRRLSVIEAFQTVPDAQKRELQTLFRWDFELFGYDPHPPEVFNETVKSTSLFDLWK